MSSNMASPIRGRKRRIMDPRQSIDVRERHLNGGRNDLAMGQPDASPEDPMERVIPVRLIPRWIAPSFLVFSFALVLWIIYLGFSLPQRVTTQHYKLFWLGFDAALVSVMCWTGWLALRQRREVQISAVVTATLLFVDAWLDITTARPGRPLVEGLLQAAFLELPIACFSLYISRSAGRALRVDTMVRSVAAGGIGERTPEQVDAPHQPVTSQQSAAIGQGAAKDGSGESTQRAS